MATLNIRDFGATPDDGTNDTDAIQSAFDAATAGDTVYVPAGTYHVRAPDPTTSGATALRLDRDVHPDNLTITGDGEASRLKLLGDHTDNHVLWRVTVEDGWSSLTISDLTIDGNKDAQSAVGGGIGLLVGYPNSGASNDVRIEHCWFRDANQNNLSVRYASNVKVYNVTSTGAGSDHGIAIAGGANHEVKRCYCAGNGKYGVDVGMGSALVEDCVLENNGWGSKTTAYDETVTYRRVRFSNNEHFGYLRNPVDGGPTDVTFEDCIAENNGLAGFNFGQDTNYTVGTIVARGNDGDNININDNSTLTAEHIYSCDAVGGAGVDSNTSGSASVGTYTHSGNDAGAYGSTSSLSVGTSTAGTADGVLTNVPTADEVGAGRETTSSHGVIRTSSGTLQSSNGVIETR
jgi:hypothetical protein